MTSKKVFLYTSHLTSNFTERFLPFPDSSCQEKCTQLFKTFNVKMPSPCKKHAIQLLKTVAFLLQFGILFYTTLTNFSTKYLVMCKVYAGGGDIK